jgi:hypothetical protein
VAGVARVLGLTRGDATHTSHIYNRLMSRLNTIEGELDDEVVRGVQ